MQIGSEICHLRKAKDSGGKGETKEKDSNMIEEVLYKVVKDDIQGTDYWAVIEAADRHVSTLMTAATSAVDQYGPKIEAAEATEAPCY